jgi:hypothetical protein
MREESKRGWWDPSLINEFETLLAKPDQYLIAKEDAVGP